MKVVIAGKNNIAISVLKHIRNSYPSIKIIAVCNENDLGIDSDQLSFKKFCISNNIELAELSHVYESNIDVFISLEFDKIIKPNNLKTTKVYNIHFSLLPAYKGMYTSAWPIINGESKTGVTLHYIDQGIDTGLIIAQKEFNITFNETASSLYKKYIEHGTELVVQNISNLLFNKIIGTPQPEIGASYYDKRSIDFSNLRINYRKTAYEIKNQINAFTYRRYQLVKFKEYEIFGCEITSNKSRKKPGTVLEVNKACIRISTIDYDIKLYIDVFDSLLESCSKGDENVQIFCNKYNVNEKNKLGWSPIIVSAYHGNRKALDFLLSKGADINDTNYKGTTVFMYAKDYALSSGDYSFLRYLVEKGADHSLRDHIGKDVFDYMSKEQGNRIKDLVGI